MPVSFIVMANSHMEYKMHVKSQQMQYTSCVNTNLDVGRVLPNCALPFCTYLK